MGCQIFAAEVSHEDTPLAIREKLAANEITAKQHLFNLSAVTDEVFVLSTCNRFAVYAIADSIEPLTDFFEQYPALRGFVQFYYNSEESITHLFAVSSGLLSPIKGDHEILEQLKQAHRWALECNAIGIALDHLLRHCISVGKKVRTETGIDKFCSSVVDAGIELLYDRVDDLHNKHFLIVGTGKVARLALKYLYNEGIENVHIVSQDRKRAVELADLYYVNAIGIEDLHKHAMRADVIIGCTHYDVSLFPESFLSGFLRHEKMWFVLDFGMPRNFNGKLGEHSCVELYNLDDLKRLYKSPLDAFGGIEAAWKIVMHEANMFMEVIMQLEQSPVLVAFWTRLLNIQRKRTGPQLPRLESGLSKVDLSRIKKQARKLMRDVSTDLRGNARSLVNNHQAENPRALVASLIGFSKVRLTITMN